MLSKCEPRYTSLDRTTFVRNYIPAMYEQEKVKVSNAPLSDMQSFAITTNGWTSRSNCSYVSLTVHYINKNWEMCYHLLETSKALGRAKSLVSHFNHSCKSSYVLHNKQRHLKHDEQSLIQNSTYYMIEIILKQQPATFCSTN